MKTTHNGWANVETWRLQLHLYNNEGLNMVCTGLAGVAAVSHTPAEALADSIREYVAGELGRIIDTTDDGLPMFAADMVETALARVDWEQIANAWLDPAGHAP